MSYWFRFVLAVLATWRVTHGLVYEYGPWRILERLRIRFASGALGSLLGCFKCFSLWVSVPFAFFVGGDLVERVVAWLAVSGGSIVIEQWASPTLGFQVEETDRSEPGNEGLYGYSAIPMVYLSHWPAPT